MRDKDDLDLLIDAALATYGDPGADGLEERTLRGVQRHLASRRPPRYLRWLAWSVAPAAAACVLAFIFFPTLPSKNPVKDTDHSGTQENPRGNNAAVTKNPVPAAGSRTTPGPARAAGTRTKPPLSTETAKANPLPKLDVFPTPAPLDEQVEALAFFIRQAPPNEVKELLAKQAQADAPLAFKQLEIPPLEPLDEGGK